MRTRSTCRWWVEHVRAWWQSSVLRPATTPVAVARYVGASYLLATGLDSLRDTMSRAQTVHPERFSSELAQAVSATAASVLALWLPLPAALVGLVGMAQALLFVPTAADLQSLLVTGLMLAATARPRTVVLWAGTHACYLIARTMRSDAGPASFWIYALLLTAAYGAGLVARRFVDARRAGDARVAELLAENARIAARERSRLAVELERVVTEALRRLRDVVGAARSPDPATSEAAWGEFDGLTRATLSELRRLVGELRTPDGGARAADAVLDRVVGALRGVATVALGVAGIAHATGGLSDPVRTLVSSGAYLAAVLLLWLPLPGLILGAVVLMVSLVTSEQPAGALVLLVLTPAILAVRPNRPRVTLAAGVLGGLTYVLIGALSGTTALAWWFGAAGASVVGLLAGALASHFVETRRRTKARLAELQREQVRSRGEERNRLARELHDVVAHQLSIVALQVMAHGDAEDAAERATALDSIDEAATAAQHDLALLVDVMGRDATDGGGEPAGDSLLVPTAVAHSLSGTLTDQGHPASFHVPPEADRLDPSVRRTLVRTMQEATTNALRYSSPDAPFTCRIERAGDRVNLTASSPLPTATVKSSLSTGHGLRGIRERVALTGGTFSAGPVGQAWRVHVSLPLS